MPSRQISRHTVSTALIGQYMPSNSGDEVTICCVLVASILQLKYCDNDALYS